MISEFIKLLGLCVIAAIIALILKSKSGEFAFLISIGAGVVVLICCLDYLVAPIKEITEKLADYGIETNYFKVALKAVGLAYITDFFADACRDAGQASMASKAELVGKIAIFVLSVPLLMSVIETAVGFIK